MKCNWPLVKIDDLKANTKGSIAIGPFGSRMKSECYVDEGIPVIRGTNITEGPDFKGVFVFITEGKADELGSCNVYQNDLVFPHRGSIGEVGIVLDDRRYVLSSSLMKISCNTKKVNPQFLYYFFKSKLGRYELLKNASQVGTPGIGQPLTSLKGIELRLPPLLVQDQIAVTLSSLNQKITLNNQTNQTNQTLEAMAQAIFKSWFVDFDPVKAKMNGEQPAGMDAATASLFPEKLVESELGLIPEGWDAGTLSDVAKYCSARTSIDSICLDNYISTENMLADRKGVTAASKLPTAKMVAAYKTGDVLVSNIRPYFKKIWLAEGNGGRSNDVLGFESSVPNTDAYIMNLLYQDTFFEYMTRTSKGAKMPRGDKTAIMNWEIAVPPVEFREAYTAIVDKFYKLIPQNRAQNETLESLRDTLLPKLLLGEIELGNLQVEQVKALVE